jgi:hypothetical protein
MIYYIFTFQNHLYIKFKKKTYLNKEFIKSLFIPIFFIYIYTNS